MTQATNKVRAEDLFGRAKFQIGDKVSFTPAGVQRYSPDRPDSNDPDCEVVFVVVKISVHQTATKVSPFLYDLAATSCRSNYTKTISNVAEDEIQPGGEGVVSYE